MEKRKRRKIDNNGSKGLHFAEKDEMQGKKNKKGTEIFLAFLQPKSNKSQQVKENFDPNGWKADWLYE